VHSHRLIGAGDTTCLWPSLVLAFRTPLLLLSLLLPTHSPAAALPQQGATRWTFT
jgi:hypothetical protein